ncbi:MAG: hypothetical protein Q8898_02265 [Bacillota bacterium]|nr:hypothetical protein [Bacillota bacterium]
MTELIGNCLSCGKELFCFDGFFSGEKSADGTLLCFECFEKATPSPNNQE